MSRLLPLIEPLEARYAPATLSIILDPSSVVEGNSGEKTITFKVKLSEAPTQDVEFDYFTRSGTALVGEDFVGKSEHVVFEAPAEGEDPVLEKEFTITIKSDAKFETDEDFQIVLHNASGADLENGQAQLAATATITNDDERPVISIGNASIAEGNIPAAGPGTPTKMVFTVTLSNPSSETVAVMLSTIDGTALAGSDYVARLNQELTFAPGETSKTFEVVINGDTIGEASEDFTVKLTEKEGGNGTVSTTANEGKGTITNDDPILRVADVRIAEGTRTANSPNTVQMVFTVVLDRAGNTGVVTVDYETLGLGAEGGGTATPGVDYVADQSGTLQFSADDTSKTITIVVNKDSIVENDETVLLHLSNATNAFIEDGDAVGTIANDEIQASLTLLGDLPIRKKEGEFTNPVKYKITLSGPVTDPAGVDVVLSFGGGATAGDDYTIDGYELDEDGNITVHFGPDDPLSKEIHINVEDDDLASANETAQVSISSTKNAVINTASSQASFEILNDDGTAYLIVDDLTVIENVDGGKAKVKVRLDRLVEGDVTFNFSTTGGTAAAGQDFTTSTGTGTIKISEGEQEAFIEIPLTNDALDEKDEVFTVQISGGTGGATADSLSAKKSATVTITDDDAPVIIGFESTEVVKIVEGDSGTKMVTFKVKLTNPAGVSTASGREVSVRAIGVSGTAIAGQDFTFDQVIKIAAGQTEATFTVPINGDRADEIDETFTVQLSEPDGATIDPAKDEAPVSILNDDRKIFIEDVTVSEGAGQVKFKVKLDAASLHPITVKFKTSNGTALAGDDYVAAGEGFPTVTIPAGETEVEVTINLVNDGTSENSETFFGELFDATGAAISVSKATATITNDDQAFRISDGRIVEGPNGSITMMAFTVKREGSGVATVNYATQNGTAVAGQDFNQLTGTLTFGETETEKTILVEIRGDATTEGDSENFSVKLSNPSSGTLLDDTGVGTIIDDESALVSISDAQVVEGDNGSVQMIFVVTVTGVVNGTVRLNYATEAGTATTDDFTSTNGTLNFTGAGSQSIIVNITGDRIDEGDFEEFFVKLTKGSGSATVNLVDDTGVGRITDDGPATANFKDPLPIISVDGGRVIEGNNGETAAIFKLKLDRPSSKPVTVKFGLNGGSATPGVDYTDIPDTIVTFLPGQTEAFITVPVSGDTEVEMDEFIQAVLSEATNATTVGGENTPARIVNDEITATIAAGTKIENAAATDTGKMRISLSQASTQAVTVRFVVNNGTAVRGTDFEFVDSDNSGTAFTFDSATGVGTVTIPAGQAFVDLEFKMLDDTSDPKFEGTEKFTVTLTEADGATVPTGDAAKGTFSITDNEQVTVSIEDQYLFEGETTLPVIGTPTVPGKVGGPFSDPPPEPTVKTVQIKLKLSAASTQAITVKASSFLDSETSAIAGSDFQAFQDKEITFAPGETEKTISVEIIDDQIDEDEEKFKIRLAEATEGSLNGATLDEFSTITILDNDLRGISIADSSVVEGKGGAKKTMSFTVKLSAASGRQITVDPTAIQSGGATAGIDFSTVIGGDVATEGPLAGLIVFAPGETEKTITVEIFDDGSESPTTHRAEGDETFVLQLSDATGGIITDAQANGRIITDEIIYKLTPNTATVGEGSSAELRTITFTVTKEFAPGFSGSDASLLNAPGSVTFKTVDGTAKANGDYVAKTGTLQFAQGDTSESFTIVVNNDTAFENDETFVVELTGSTGGALADAAGLPQDTLQSTITIQSDDNVAPTLSIGDVRIVEGPSNTKTFVFQVNLSAANDTRSITVDFQTEDGTATSLLGDFNFQDFLAQSGTLTFEPGETTKTISVTVNGDNRHESDETFKVKLSNAQGATITDAEGLGTIVNDDAVPTLIFDGATNGVFTVVEGNSGNSRFVFKIKLSNPSEQDITFKLELDPAGLMPGDFQVVGDFPDQITIKAGATEVEVEAQLPQFNIVGDLKDEADESFQVRVTQAEGSGPVQIPISTATVTIADDDAAPRLTINDMFVVEGPGLQKIRFTVTLDGVSDRPISVDFATLDGTAVAGGATPDYVARTGPLEWAAGETGSKIIEIDVLDDPYKEANETFQVKLSNAVNATIARDTGTGTIQVDEADDRVFLTIKDAKIVEGTPTNNGATKRTITFTVELSGATDEDVIFTANTENGSAIGTFASATTGPGDFDDINQQFTIPAGSTSVSVTVSVRMDNIFEATEDFFVKLSGVSSNVEVVRDTARGTIYNDDIQFVNSRTVRYVDEDGDLVTLKITKGSLSQANIRLEPKGDVGGQVLTLIDFTERPGVFNGTSLFVTAERQVGFDEATDGKADVGFIRAAIVDVGNNNEFAFSNGIDFNKIVIDGDLGAIQAGDTLVNPSIRGVLSAGSIGVKTEFLPVNDQSNPITGSVAFFLCKVNAIETKGDISGQVRVIGGSFGDIGSLTIGGALRGLSESQPGTVIFGGTLGKATIGQIIGGDADLSGAINAATNRPTKINSIRVLDGILGGAGVASGSILAKNIGSVSIGTDPTSDQAGIIGGSGTNSGLVFAQSIGHVVVGNGSQPALIKGGSGESSGRINALGSLGSVTVHGDLVGGSQANSGQIFANTLGSLRINGSLTGGNDNDAGSVIVNNGGVNSIAINEIKGGSVQDTGYISVPGSVGSLTIGSNAAGGGLIGGTAQGSGRVEIGGSVSKATIYGELRGGSASNTGFIEVSGNLSSLTINGDLVGGSGQNSGQVAAANIGSLKVVGSVLGGSGSASGSVFSTGTGRVDSVTITESLVGGTGERSGYLKIGGGLGSLAIGSGLSVDRHLVGGGGSSSGLVEVGGSLSNAKIHGDLRGGTSSSTGGLKVGGAIGTLEIGGDFEGGSSSSNGQQTGFITADRIARMTIQGDWTSGAASGIADSGSIRVSKDIGNLVVNGDVLGTSTSRIVLAAAGGSPNNVAIGNLTIGGNVEYMDILGGYGTGASSSKPTGNLVNADAVIENVTIKGNVLATNIVSGVGAGVDGRLGTSDDEISGGITNNAKLVSLIAKVTIEGTVGETAESYGIVAQYVKSVSANGIAVALQKGASNDKGGATQPIGGSATFRVIEI